MKKITLLLLTTACILQTAFSQSVSINNDASVADASAILDVKSISKGMLLPRMTMAQRNAIATPANGLIIYQTDNTPGFYSYNATAWAPIGANSLPAGAIVMSEIKHDPSLENNGFSYKGYLNSSIDGQEQTAIIPPNTWYPVNASEPDNSSAPACGTYWGPFWDGTKVFGLNFSSIYYYDFATDKYSYETFTPLPGAGGYVNNWIAKQCGDYIICLYRGLNNNNNTMKGFKYHVPSKTWSAISSTNIPASRKEYMSVSTGTTLIVWGGQNADDDYFSNGGIYNPASDSWTTIAYPNPLLNIPARIGASAIWTGTQLYVWGGGTRVAATSTTTHCAGINYTLYTNYNDGFKYTPATGSYSNHIGSNTLSPRTYHAGVWTGTEMVVWGGGLRSETVVATHYQDYTQTPPIDYWGCDEDYEFLNYKTGGKYNPATNTWTYMNPPAAIAIPTRPKMIWTGTGIIAYDEGTSKVYLYNPATNTWPNSYPNFPDLINNGDLISTGDKIFGFAYCTSNNKMIGYALSKTDPVSIYQVLNTVNQKLYLYKKN